MTEVERIEKRLDADFEEMSSGIMKGMNESMRWAIAAGVCIVAAIFMIFIDEPGVYGGTDAAFLLLMTGSWSFMLAAERAKCRYSKIMGFLDGMERGVSDVRDITKARMTALEAEE